MPKIQYQKELRWLTFLLGPFFILLSLHILVPQLISSSSYNTLQLNYNLKTTQLRQSEARSIHLQNSNIISTFFYTQMMFLNTILNLNAKGMDSFLNVKENNFTFNNAYRWQINLQSNTSNHQKQNQSMWFVTNADQLSNLPPQFEPMLQIYEQFQPYIKAMFSLKAESPLQSISFSINNQNSSLFFQYPTQYNKNYRFLNASALDKNYNQTIEFFNKFNKSSNVVPILSFDQMTNTSIIALCIPSISLGYAVVACLNIDLQIAAKILVPELTINEDNNWNSTIYLLFSPSLSSPQKVNPPIAIKIKGQNQIFFNNSLYFNVSENNLSINLFQFQSSNNPDLNFYQISADTTFFYITPISNQNGNLIMPMYFVTQANVMDNHILSNEMNMNSNTLIIPILVLVVAEAIFSTLILKYLLDSVDKQLYALENRCQKIVVGDINIQIPPHQGTKDITAVYNQVRIINKLHKYSTQSYFTGHFSQKILKYVQALQFIKNLKYNPGNLLENLGECYTYLEQWDNSIKFLKESVTLIMKQIQQEYGKFDDIYAQKLQKVALPRHYREKQLILIRRLFKLNFSYIKYLEMGPTRLKAFQIQNPKDETFKKKLQLQTQQFSDFTVLIKKAFYPNFSKFSQCIIILLFESKQHTNNNNLAEADRLHQKVEEYTKIYAQNYSKTTKLLREKGSKFKLFHQSNKLTFHSRSNPVLLDVIACLLRAKWISASQKSPRKLLTILDLFYRGLMTASTTMNSMYMIVIELRKLILSLKLDVDKFESTQIFKQAVPYKTLHYGEKTKQNQTMWLRMAKKESVGLQRQFVLLFDCQRNYSKNKDQHKFYSERVNHLFNKLIKGHDRISIIRFNVRQGINIQCNLILKQYNQALLKKAIDECVDSRNESKTVNNELISAINKALWRTKKLCSQKVIVVFFRSIAHYQTHCQRIRRKQKSRYLKTRSPSKCSQTNISQESIHVSLNILGDSLIDFFQNEEVRNFKLIFYCAQQDNIVDFRNYFGLRDINRRIWNISGGINEANNVVYIIEDKNKTDIDRILMLKAVDVPDNNIFVL